MADDAVAVLHGEAGRNPHDSDLTALVGELSTRSDDFRVRWARHDVRYQLGYEVMTLVADEELTMFVYTADPGSRSEESLSLLASWTTSAGRERLATVHEPSEQET